MKRGAALLVAGLVAAALLGRPAGAQSDEATRHFRAGVALYQQSNYPGALVEFEEAYRLHPTSSALQNIALCQKSLFRYADAVATLERMLRDYAGTLAPADAEAARAAAEELRPLVASVVIAVSPADAQVTIDERPVAGGAERRVEVSVGEHKIVAEAPRHQRYEQVVKLAGGARRVEITLAPREGELAVVAEDSEAVVAIDGVPRGYGAWRGRVSAGETHAVRIWKPGHLERTTEVVLEQGEEKELHLPVGPIDPGLSATLPPPARAAGRRGYYALVTASVYVLGGDPDGFQAVKGDSGARDGSYFGLRLGDRLVPNFGLELMFEAGKHTIGQVCSPPSPGDCTAPGGSYGLRGQRLGINGKYFSSGDRVRFVAALGFGGVNHTLITGASGVLPAEQSGSALNAYVFAEAGLELNIGHALIDGVLTGTIDGVNNLEVGSVPAYTDHRDVNMVGLGIRVGYGQW